MIDPLTAVTVSLLGLPAGRLAALLREDLRRGRAPTPGWPDPGALLGALKPEASPKTPFVARARSRAAEALERAARTGIEPISLFEARYPPALAAIPDPPLVLWVRGHVESLGRLAVAVVGSRAASAYAIEVAGRLAGDLAGRGVIVVSGLARGVDAAAHRGALVAGGVTVAVLGSGPDIIYPPEHDGLAAEAAGTGAVVSELPPGTPPRREFFPARNRLISGLAMAVVVVEASDRSGSLITARCGLEQGREVLAVPGGILSGRFRGSHGLIRDGARVVETAGDVLEEIGVVPDPAPPVVARVPPALPGPLQALVPGESYTLDELVECTGVRAERLLPRLLELEMKGLVRRVAGGRFMRSASCG